MRFTYLNLFFTGFVGAVGSPVSDEVVALATWDHAGGTFFALLEAIGTGSVGDEGGGPDIDDPWINSGMGEEELIGRLLSNMLELVPMAPSVSLGVSGTGVTAW